MSKNLIVAGPCSAETENQVFQTARFLYNAGIKYYRAGLWKPRSSPNSFEGVGKTGLDWLTRIKHEFGLKIGTEVANREHIERCAQASIDFVWLGARTVTNPFTIQEISNIFKDMDMNITVFVKNPVVADIALWLGAIERLQKAGITKIVAVHRGFHQSNSIYRNAPHWSIPIEFKRIRADIPLLCDPSHIAGNSSLVETVAIQASKLGFDGLMIEVHNNPKQALSDSKQQITHKQFLSILSKIKFGTSSNSNEILSVFRAQIDELDKSLLDIITQRMELSFKIGEYKKTNDMSVLQPARYDELLSNSLKYAQEKKLSTDFIKQIIELIHQESINRQL